MPAERTGAVTLNGNPLTLMGEAISVGDKAPDFSVLAGDLSEVNLATDHGKVRLVLSVPSLDTPLCDKETRKFSDKGADFPDNVVVYTVSCDLPTAQNRWCGIAGIENVKLLSDHRDMSFAQAYGTWIKELRLLSRAVFVIDKNDVVQYVEYVREIGEHPNYDAAVGAVNKVATK